MKSCRQLQFLSICINRRETEIMRSQEIKYARACMHGCALGHWEGHMAGRLCGVRTSKSCCFMSFFSIFSLYPLSSMMCNRSLTHSGDIAIAAILGPPACRKLVKELVDLIGHQKCTSQFKQVTVSWSRMNCDEFRILGSFLDSA